MTITEFLLARIDEDEAVARVEVDRAAGSPRRLGRSAALRLARECESKRRIVEVHTPIDNKPDGWCTMCDGDGWPCATMAALASVYADHPDFDPAWGAS